jgi:hypothetical protein
MMSYCAQLDNVNVVTQVIVGDSVWAATNLGGFWVEITDVTGYPGIGWEWTGQVFRSPQPAPDCVWDAVNNVWDCPDPEPSQPVTDEITGVPEGGGG